MDSRRRNTEEAFMRSNPNMLRLGDRINVRLPWACESFEVVIKAFRGSTIEVEAVEKSDDPLVDNEFVITYSSVVQ